MQHERPLSPHLTIYKPQITSVLSISHRASGAFLALGFIPLVAWLWAAAFDAAYFAQWQEWFTCWAVQLALFGWTLAFFYHLSNGMRHLWWDMGKGFELKQVTLSGIKVVLMALALTLVTWYHVITTLDLF